MKPEAYVVYDLETTGFNPDSNDIIQISALKIADGNVEEEFNRYIRISGHIPFEITKLTGITDQLLKEQGVPLARAMEEFGRFCRKPEGSRSRGANPFFILIAHNGKRFDSKFLLRAVQNSQFSFPTYQMDSLILAKEAVPGLGSYQLGKLAERVGADTTYAHRADADVKMLYAILEKELFLHSTKEALRKACFKRDR